MNSRGRRGRREEALLLFILLLAACDKPATNASPKKVTAEPPPIEEPSEFVDYAFRITNDARTAGGMACWGCYHNARVAIRAVPGVETLEVHPDEGYINLRYERRKLRDRTDLVMAIKKAMPDAEIEPLTELPELSRRVKLTNEVPPDVRALLDQATAARPLIVIKLTGRGACTACTFKEPAWGDRVLRADVDVDTAGVKPWLAPQAVPEWVALDRQGNELGRWLGVIDMATFDEKLERLVMVASR